MVFQAIGQYRRIPERAKNRMSLSHIFSKLNRLSNGRKQMRNPVPLGELYSNSNLEFLCVPNIIVDYANMEVE